MQHQNRGRFTCIHTPDKLPSSGTIKMLSNQKDKHKECNMCMQKSLSKIFQIAWKCLLCQWGTVVKCHWMVSDSSLKIRYFLQKSFLSSINEISCF